MAGLRQAPVSCAGQLLAEPRALPLLQNTLRLDETLLVTGGGDAWQTDPSLLSSLLLLYLVVPYRLCWHCSCPALLISSNISGDSSSNNSRPPDRHSGLRTSCSHLTSHPSQPWSRPTNIQEQLSVRIGLDNLKTFASLE